MTSLKTYLFRLFYVVVLLTTPVFSQSNFIPYNHPQISYEGRISEIDNEAVELYWSGTSISLSFEGTNIQGIFKEEQGGNYYDVYVDGTLLNTIKPGTRRSKYLLASNLIDKEHTIEIFKRTEYDRGKSWFYGLELEEDSRVLPKNQKKKLRIEYYGDSITAGYSVDDYSGNDSPDSIHTNYSLSYANIISEYFDTEQHCICKSGIGITASWFPYIMPDIWDRTDPLDENSEWDFSSYSPDLVVINLFQNDSWIVNMMEHPSFKLFYNNKAPSYEELVKAYADFIKGIRNKYPQASIIATLGSMDITQEGSEWPSIVSEAVSSLNDDNVYSVFTPYKNTPGHPKVDEQKVIAQNLITFIEKKLGW